VPLVTATVLAPRLPEPSALMDRAAFKGVASEKPAWPLLSMAPWRLPEEIRATPEKSGTVLSPGSPLPKKKFPDRELAPYVAAGCVSKMPRLAEGSMLMQKADTPSKGFVR